MAISNLGVWNTAASDAREDRSGVSKLRHVIESQQFTLPLLMELFQRSRGMERVVARGGTLEYQNKILANLFYQPSTRTRFSFESAMYRLGGKVLSTEQASAFSSEVAGEQVEDSIRIIANYSDVIVVRHPQAGGAQRAAQVSPVPVINAGDGDGGQHPTQALLDLYTIYRERPLTGLSVAIVGELDRGRTARSLAYLLAKFDRVRIFFVAPQELQMKPDILEYLDEHGIRYELESDVDRVIGEADVIYQTRIRPERVADAQRMKPYAIDSALLRKMKSDALIMHPLPRTVELDKSVDDDPRALYFRQAANGLYVRMALLTMLLDRNQESGVSSQGSGVRSQCQSSAGRSEESEMKGHRDLVAWQKAMHLVKAVYTVTRNFPKEEVYGLTNQLRRAAVSLPSNLAEGPGRLSRKEFRQFIGRARGSLLEVETQLEIARELGYLNRLSASELLAASRELGRLLNGLRQWSERNIDTDPDDGP